MLMNIGSQAAASKNGLLTTIGWRLGGRTTYCLEGSVFVAGAAVQWLRDGLGLIATSGDVERLAGRARDAGGIYFVPALVGLGAPHWDPYARGVVVGIERGTTAAHLARAAVESMAFQTLDVVEAMESDAGVRLGALRVDGGAVVNDDLLQFQADVLGKDGGTAQGQRDDRARSGVSGGAGHRLLERPSRGRRALGPRSGVPSQHDTESSRRSHLRLAQGSRAVPVLGRSKGVGPLLRGVETGASTP